MAKINKSEVMQKLIDELELYPAADLIPSELADKILATYQVNSQDVNVTVEETTTVYSDETLNDQNKTFTVPAGKKWKVKHIAARMVATATVGNRIFNCDILDDSGNIIWRISSSDSWCAASQTGYKFMLANWTGAPAADSNWANVETYPFPQFVLPAGYQINIYDNSGVSAEDDMYLYIYVNEEDA